MALKNKYGWGFNLTSHKVKGEDLSLPQVILVDVPRIPWIFFWQWTHPNSVFSVHGLSMDNPHNTMIFIIFMESMQIVHGLHMD